MDLLKALHIIAEQNRLGIISDRLLIKACENYERNCLEFIHSEEYDIKVSKSFYDSLNNNDRDEEIEKSILPGTTKVVDGVVYIYALTPNAKTTYDWRVYNPKDFQSGGVNNSKQTSKKAVISQTYVNDMFPIDLGEFKPINSNIGGSTGAKMVEDLNGNEYVLKKGSNTSSAHVESEYLANQVYEILGVMTPDYQLYDDDGEKVLVSKFIYNASGITASDYNELSKNFAIDCLLANRDVYQNDNCLKDVSGRVLRVDNGSCFQFRAQGSVKSYDDNIVDDWKNMVKYNGHVVANLTEEDFIKQIDELKSKKQLVVDFLNLSNQKSLALTIEKRFDNLDKVKKYYEDLLNKKNKFIVNKNKPRVLKPADEMYKEFDDTELDSIWSNAIGSGWYNKMLDTGKNGWSLLEQISVLRGYDARPEVVSDADYWNTISQDHKLQLFRGVDGAYGNSADDFVNQFKYDDTCFYGSIGIYGSGIYFHMNDNPKGDQHTKSDYQNSKAYGHARAYGSSIIEAAVSKNAKIIEINKLRAELDSLNVFDTEAAKQIDKKIKALEKDLKQKSDYLNNITQKTEDDVKNRMHWDNDSYVMHAIEIDNIDWGEKDLEGNLTYPKFDSFFPNVKKWVEDNGGTATEKIKGSGEYILKMPNSKETFHFSKYSYNLPSAIKQKNAFTKAYNYPVKRFQNWFVTNHFAIINKEIEKEIANIGPKVTEMKNEIRDIKINLNDEQDNLNKVKSKNVNPDKDIISACIHCNKNGYKQALGTYAALAGYDAIRVPDGNNMGNSFLVVLNRSKIIVKE